METDWMLDLDVSVSAATPLSPPSASSCFCALARQRVVGNSPRGGLGDKRVRRVGQTWCVSSVYDNV